MLESLQILAPGLLEQPWSQVQALGAATWLWTHSYSHRELPLHSVQRLLLPAILQRQFVLVSQDDLPVFYAAWALFNQESERRYLRLPPACLRADEWHCGERLWITDFIAPFGHASLANRLLRKRLLATRVMRFLYHRGETRGLRIITVPGSAVSKVEFRYWQQTHPLDLGP